jgi:hypothetical protein
MLKPTSPTRCAPRQQPRAAACRNPLPPLAGIPRRRPTIFRAAARWPSAPPPVGLPRRLRRSFAQPTDSLSAAARGASLSAATLLSADPVFPRPLAPSFGPATPSPQLAPVTASCAILQATRQLLPSGSWAGST